MKGYRASSSAETRALGAGLAKKIIKEGPGRKAKAICLRGDLGAGKTTFTQGFLGALGVRGRMTSPTFVLMKRFPVPKGRGFSNAYHIDAYRFRAAGESGALGLKKIFEDPSAIVVIEWPERLGGMAPKSAINIRFRHGKHEEERVIIAP